MTDPGVGQTGCWVLGARNCDGPRSSHAWLTEARPRTQHPAPRLPEAVGRVGNPTLSPMLSLAGLGPSRLHHPLEAALVLESLHLRLLAERLRHELAELSRGLLVLEDDAHFR